MPIIGAPLECEREPVTRDVAMRSLVAWADVAVGLAIHESYVILGSELQDLKLYKVMNRRGSRCPARRSANNERRL